MGIHHEDTLLQETASREEHLLGTISDLESELKSARQNLERLMHENDRLSNQNSEICQQAESLENTRKNLKKEIKEFKVREHRNMQDYSELEEENISLQKQVLQLKQAQVDYEGFKHDKIRLQEDVDILNGQVEELINLKKIVEKNLEEALHSLEQEREQKHAIKKELDARLTSESIFNLSNLAHLGLGDSFRGQHETNNTGGGREDLADGSNANQPALKRIEAGFRSSSNEERGGTPATPPQSSGMVGDLFSELHMTEIRKLEQMLEKKEYESTDMQKQLEEYTKKLEDSHKEKEQQQEQVSQLKAHISAMSTLNDADVKSFVGKGGIEENGELEEGSEEVVDLKKSVKRHELQYAAALKQISELTDKIKDLQERKLRGELDRAGEADLKDEVMKLSSKVSEYEETVKNLETDLKAMTQVAGETQGSLNCTQEELVRVTEELEQLYHHVCEVNGETPNRVMLDHIRATRLARQESSKDSDAASDKSASSSRSGGTEEEAQKKEKGKEAEGDGDLEYKGDPITCYKLTETIHDQVKYLRRGIEHTIEMNRQRSDDSNRSEDVEELQQHVMKLKAMLSTKREQIATLRSVLKANKSTAEMALANLKQKYENEKIIVTETMNKLRNELKALKEDAATFASLRAMFAQRCDEYVTQLDEMQRQHSAAEEEKKTLNSLLRMAIQQKLALTQRLEDLEFDRERRNMRGRSGRGKAGSSKVSHNYSSYDDHSRYPQRHQRRDY